MEPSQKELVWGRIRAQMERDAHRRYVVWLTIATLTALASMVANHMVHRAKRHELEVRGGK